MDGLRGYAAGLVFLCHSLGLASRYYKNIWDMDIYAQPSLVEQIIYWLHRSMYGVDLFFLLSGYLIATQIWKAGLNFSYTTFFAHRVARVYPAFLLCTVIYILYSSFYYHLTWITPSITILNIMLVNGMYHLVPAVPGINAVTWSLTFEFMFYIVSPAILIIKKDPAWVAVVALSACAVFYYFCEFNMIPNGNIRFIMFFSGIFIASCSNDSLRKIDAIVDEKVAVAFYIATTILYAVEAVTLGVFMLLYFVSAGLLMVKTVFGNGFCNKLFSTLPLRYLGRVSYSFYLIHVFTIAITYDEMKFSFFLGLPIAFLLSVGAASIMYWFAERPYFVSASASRSRRLYTLSNGVGVASLLFILSYIAFY